MQKMLRLVLGALVLLGSSVASQAKEEPVGISGAWTGTAADSEGGSNNHEALLVKEHADGTLTGQWGFSDPDRLWAIEKGERVTATLVQWEGSDGQGGYYRVRCRQNGTFLLAEWTYTRKVEGKVKGYTGATIFVRESRRANLPPQELPWGTVTPRNRLPLSGYRPARTVNAGQ